MFKEIIMIVMGMVMMIIIMVIMVVMVMSMVMARTTALMTWIARHRQAQPPWFTLNASFISPASDWLGIVIDSIRASVWKSPPPTCLVSPENLGTKTWPESWHDIWPYCQQLARNVINQPTVAQGPPWSFLQVHRVSLGWVVWYGEGVERKGPLRFWCRTKMSCHLLFCKHGQSLILMTAMWDENGPNVYVYKR